MREMFKTGKSYGEIMGAAEIIKSENTRGDLSIYEKLLLERDSLRKKAEQYQLSYFIEFGDLIVESFTMRIECIRKKKIISYCQQQINHGKAINGAQLDYFVEMQMKEYNKDLEDIIKKNKAASGSETVSSYDVYRIKKIYRDLAKLIHPDLHPELESDPIIEDFWQNIVIAYEYNLLDELEDLDFQVRKYLEEKGNACPQITIPDIEERIRRVKEEIESIKTTDPYMFKLILDDDDAIASKKDDLKEEINSYREYSNHLEGIITQFNIERCCS